MPSSCFDQEENNMFFDSLDRCLSLEESSLSFSGRDFGLEIWIDEPQSVEERRKYFMRQMGFVEDRLTDCEESVANHCEDIFEEEEERNSTVSIEESSKVIIGEEFEELCSVEEGQRSQNPSVETKRSTTMRSWWKWFVKTRKAKKARRELAVNYKAIKVSCQRNKRFQELTAPRLGQEIRAHEGFVWAMKFSPDGQYLASGGEDGVVRVWRVLTVEASFDHCNEDNLSGKLHGKKFGFRRQNPIHVPVVFPERVFRIEESPLHEFRGHSGDVLDLAWSSSNRILSSSMDKTVRLWQLGCEESVNIFQHNDYVTCIEFNPADENYFISGSIDGKVRIWGSIEERVVDWSDVRDLITAITYHPDGKGFIVGTITGTCRSYKTSGECMLLESNIKISGRKKTSGIKINGIKFSHDEPRRIMISSEDSKIRIFDGVDLIHKYKGLAKSGSQTSASFTSSETHVVSVGDDSRVYVWNYDSTLVHTSKSTRHCEHFMHEGVSVAIPWSGMITKRSDSDSIVTTQVLYESQLCESSKSFSWSKNWFSTDGNMFAKGSATWPEEKLPVCDLANKINQYEQIKNGQVAGTWGLVIVAAGSDGIIRTIHNYGLPIRL